MVKVSIITAVYNREKLIGETIQSVLNQTYSDFEMIIVDDGSTDRTRQVVKSFDDNRIRLLEIDHIGIPGAVRNSGIKTANGQFIAILDSDDLWFPEKIQVCLEYLSSESIDMVCSNEYVLRDNLSNPQSQEILQKNTKEQAVGFIDLFLNNIISSGTVMIKKECLDQTGIFSESINKFGVEDFDLWLRLAAQFTIHYIDKPLGFYRMHAGSISQDTEKALINNYNVLTDFFFDARYKQQFSSKLSQTTSHIRKKQKSIIKYYVKNSDIKNIYKWMKIILFFQRLNLSNGNNH